MARVTSTSSFRPLVEPKDWHQEQTEQAVQEATLALRRQLSTLQQQQQQATQDHVTALQEAADQKRRADGLEHQLRVCAELLEEQTASYKQCREQLIVQQQEFQNNLRELQSTAVTQAEIINRAETESSELRAKYQDMQQQLWVSQAQVQQQSVAAELTQTEHSAAIDALSAHTDDLRDQLQQQCEESRELQMEAANVLQAERVDRAEQEVIASETAAQKDTQQQSKLTDCQLGTIQQVEVCLEQLHTSQQQVAALKNRLETAEQDALLEASKSKLKEQQLRAELEEGARALTAANRKISDLKAVPLPLEQKIALLEQELREVEGTVSNARNQAEEATGALQRWGHSCNRMYGEAIRIGETLTHLHNKQVIDSNDLERHHIMMAYREWQDLHMMLMAEFERHLPSLKKT